MCHFSLLNSVEGKNRDMQYSMLMLRIVFNPISYILINVLTHTDLQILSK